MRRQNSKGHQAGRGVRGFTLVEISIVLVIIGAVFNHWGAMGPVLWVLAVLSTITVAHRIVYTYQNTKHLAPLS